MCNTHYCSILPFEDGYKTFHGKKPFIVLGVDKFNSNTCFCSILPFGYKTIPVKTPFAVSVVDTFNSSQARIFTKAEFL